MTESLHILILEDNPADAELAIFELEEAGFVISAKVVTTEKEYVRELPGCRYDLILSDYDLPQYNGSSALLEAVKQCPDIPFILVTGAVSEDRAIEILTQGAKDYVLKGRLQLRLVPAVRRALAEAEELRARKKVEAQLREAHKNLERLVNERTAELQKELERRRSIEATLLKYNERLEILSYTAGRLLASDNPQQLVEELCSRVMAFLDCQAFFNFLVDQSAGRLHLNACAGIPPETARDIEWLDFGVAVCGCVARDGDRIIAENIPHTPDVRTELIKSFGIKAYACHPLKDQNRVIGTLSFGTRTRTTFSADDLAMMKAVADQVAIAMSRVRTADALRKITERFDMAQHAANVGTWDWDVINSHIEWSPQMFNLFLLDPQKSRASFELWESLLHPQDIEVARRRIKEALENKTILNSDYRIILPDGRIRWINSVGEGKYNNQNQAIRMIGICMDITERKQAEEDIEKRKIELESLFNNSNAGLVLFDAKPPYTVLAHNRYYQELFAEPYRSSGMVGKNIYEYAPQVEAQGVAAVFEEVARTKQAVNLLDFPYDSHPPEKAWFNWHLSPVIHDGEVVALASMSINVTDRHEAESQSGAALTALKESEEKYKTLVKYAPAAIYETDIQGTKFLSVNDVMCNILGYSREELLAIKPADLLDAEGRTHFQERIKKKLTGEAIAETIEYKIKRKDGQWIDATVNAGTITCADEQTPRIAVIAHDITERKRAEDAIRRAKEEWEQTFDTVPDLIAILDEHHRIIRVNKAMANALGIVPERCAGLPCHEAVHGLSQPPAHCPHCLTCKDGRQHVAEVHEPKLGGDFMVSTTPLCDSAGRLIGAVHVARDITARKAAEDQLAKQAAELQERTAQLEEANRELESFSYSVSHDLRAPLRAIDGLSRILLRQQDQLDENSKRQFHLIRDNVKMMGVLIDNLLSFSRVQKTSMRTSIIDMDKLARDVWEEIRGANKERDLEFSMTGILPGYGDQALIRQVLFNLLDNAVKFTKNRKPGVIEMSSCQESNRIVYRIKDNGAGFDMEYYSKLFGVFQRLHSTDDYEGTGVGLAIVQRIIVRHGGRVWGEGKENSGATFYFSLPQN